MIVSNLDLLLMDIKNMDSDKHKKYVGVENDVILENASRASEVVPEMVVRYPVIPYFNDSEENAIQLADYMLAKMHRVRRVDLLPYHTAGKSKCERIGRDYGYDAPYELTNERVNELKVSFDNRGLDARIGG